MWQGLGMTSPGLQRGKEDSWRCPDWRGMGLPVMHIEVTRPKCGIMRWPAKKREGQVEGWPQFLPHLLICSLAMVWTASHTHALTVPATDLLSCMYIPVLSCKPFEFLGMVFVA